MAENRKRPAATGLPAGPAGAGSTRRMFGSVIDYTVEKGYGFIRYSLYGQEKKIFAHHSQIICLGFRKLHEDQEVSFELGEQDGRPWAMKIRNPDGTAIAETDADGNTVERAAKVA